jgi:putative ABC transport system permease protein
VLGIPLLAGRLFDDRDTWNAPHTALVNASFARTAWPGQDPIGRLIEYGNMDGDIHPLTIIGVVGDARNTNLETRPVATVYVNYRQRPWRSTTFAAVLRSTAPAATVMASARRVLHDLDPTVPPKFDRFREVFAASLANRRFVVMMVALFAGTALVLAIAGVYGVMGYSVARRTREMGLRMALGAQARDVVVLIVKQGLLATGMGLALGLIGSLVLTRSLQAQLFDVSAWDPSTFAAVALLLATFGFLASYGPARKATRVDPQSALRAD